MSELDNNSISNGTIIANNLTSIYINDDKMSIHPCRPYMPGILYIIVQLLYIVVCILGLFGNTLVIYVVLRFSKMKTVTNMYILNLAIADELFLIGIPFLNVTMHVKHWPFGTFLCKWYMTNTSINQFTSSIFLMIMSADRYIAVCHPISAAKCRTPWISKIVSSIAWTVSAVLMIPVILFSNTITRPDDLNSCTILWPNMKYLTGQMAFTLYSFVLGFAIPLLLIFIFYLLVIRKLRTLGPKNKSKERKKSHRKVTKLVLTVITVYVFCWLPYWIAQLHLVFSEPNQCHSTPALVMFLISACLSYSNSAVNPILYAFLSDNFKKSFLKACACAIRKDENGTLQIENSVCTRRHKNNNFSMKNNTSCIVDDKNEMQLQETGLLVSKNEKSTTVTVISRSNTTPDMKENDHHHHTNNNLKELSNNSVNSEKIQNNNNSTKTKLITEL